MNLKNFQSKLRDANFKAMGHGLYQHNQTGRKFYTLTSIRLNGTTAETWKHYDTAGKIPPPDFMYYGEWAEAMIAAGWKRGNNGQLILLSEEYNRGLWIDAAGNELREETAVNYFLDSIVPTANIPF